VNDSLAGAAAAPPARRQVLWLALAVLAVAVCATALLSARRSKPAAVPPPQPSPPLDGKLYVFVRPPRRAVEPVPVEAPGGLPVREGWIMSLQVQLNQPAYTYLVWFDCQGQVLPLYPWNTESLETTGIHQPPLRQPAEVIYSPLLGGGWTFGAGAGLDTVLLLARRTPLEEGASLAALLTPLRSPALRQPEEVLVLGVQAGNSSVATLLSKHRGDEAEARAADEPLHALLLRLSEHFELVRAVRFAHAGE
jgi:hypothetical protein